MEVQGLLDRGVAPERLLQLGLEYREAALYLAGEKNLGEMKEDLRLGIHQLAKMQQTWFRGLGRRGLPATVLSVADSATVLENLSR